jgi:hypothetical protein
MGPRKRDDFDDDAETVLAPKIERPSTSGASFALVVADGPDRGKSFVVAPG